MCACVCARVCWGETPAQGSVFPGARRLEASPPRAGAGPGGGGPTARGAPAPGRSESVYAEMGQRWRCLGVLSPNV